MLNFLQLNSYLKKAGLKLIEPDEDALYLSIPTDSERQTKFLAAAKNAGIPADTLDQFIEYIESPEGGFKPFAKDAMGFDVYIAHKKRDFVNHKLELVRKL